MNLARGLHAKPPACGSVILHLAMAGPKLRYNGQGYYRVAWRLWGSSCALGTQLQIYSRKGSINIGPATVAVGHG